MNGHVRGLPESVGGNQNVDIREAPSAERPIGRERNGETLYRHRIQATRTKRA